MPPLACAKGRKPPIQWCRKIVSANRSGVLTLVAPCESSILALYLSQTSLVDCGSEFSHDPPVYVGVALISGFVDDVEIAIDQPWLSVGRPDSDHLIEELIFLASSAGPYTVVNQNEEL